MKLRPYQEELISNIRYEINSGKQSVCAVLGCGGGAREKSLLISRLFKILNYKFFNNFACISVFFNSLNFKLFYNFFIKISGKFFTHKTPPIYIVTYIRKFVNTLEHYVIT